MVATTHPAAVTRTVVVETVATHQLQRVAQWQEKVAKARDKARARDRYPQWSNQPFSPHNRFLWSNRPRSMHNKLLPHDATYRLLRGPSSTEKAGPLRVRLASARPRLRATNA